MVETFHNWVKLIYKYSTHNWIFFLVGGYFFLSLILFSFFSIDIGIPCLFKFATGHACPGCGMSHAFAHLLRFEFTEAWEHNKLSFIVIPAGSYFIIADFLSFKKKLFDVTE